MTRPEAALARQSIGRGNVNARGDSRENMSSSSQPSPPSTPPPRPSSARPFGSPLRPHSPPLPVTSSNSRTRVLSQQSTPPSRNDLIRRTSSSGPANASTASLPNPNQSDRTRSKARDLLRKHYGLGVGPPPPTGKPQDPMDLGESMDHILDKSTLLTTRRFSRLSRVRRQSLLRATDHNFVVGNPPQT